MSNGKHKEMWVHTASVQAMIANTVRDPKKRRKPYTAEDFYPKVFADRKQPAARSPITVLKTAFVNNHGNTRPHQGGGSIHRTRSS